MTTSLYCFNVSSAEEFFYICKQIGVTVIRLRSYNIKNEWFPYLLGKDNTWYTFESGNLGCFGGTIQEFIKIHP